MKAETTIGHLITFRPCRSGLRTLLRGLKVHPKEINSNVVFTMKQAFEILNEDDFHWCLRAFTFKEQCFVLKFLVEFHLRNTIATKEYRRWLRGVVVKVSLFDDDLSNFEEVLAILRGSINDKKFFGRFKQIFYFPNDNLLERVFDQIESTRVIYEMESLFNTKTGESKTFVLEEAKRI